MITEWCIKRLILRWQVTRVHSFPDGVAGVRVRPFKFGERRFWRFSSAVKYVQQRRSGELDIKVTTGWPA